MASADVILAFKLLKEDNSSLQMQADALCDFVQMREFYASENGYGLSAKELQEAADLQMAIDLQKAADLQNRG